MEKTITMSMHEYEYLTHVTTELGKQSRLEFLKSQEIAEHNALLQDLRERLVREREEVDHLTRRLQARASEADHLRWVTSRLISRNLWQRIINKCSFV